MNWHPSLALVSGLVGMALMVTRLPGLLAPARFRAELLKFPRSAVWGRALLIVVAVLAGLNLHHAASDEWAWARPLVIVAVPVAYWLVIQYGESFLAIRSLGALLLFVAKLMIDSADRSDHPLRLVATVLAYLWVLAGIWMAIAPHQVRDFLSACTLNDRRCRLVCSIGVLTGALLVMLGAFVY